jgi:hypothetical protein
MAREGDQLAITKLDRLGRSLEALFRGSRPPEGSRHTGVINARY